MPSPPTLTRRSLLKNLGVAAAAVSGAALVRRADAADAPLLAADSPEARAVQYTEDARSAKAAAPGATCGSCALYQGAYGSAAGPCQIFPGKSVKASGWCSSWAAQM